MMLPPAYFSQIEQESQERWLKLDGDPGLSGPWKQLFKQVQSPRHVLSELLQNADDAGATKAIASFQNGEFIFKHNGADFTDSDFDSVCQFANSRKRTLHTIGFRGIGFKSTFSLGDPVSLKTKTLSIKFERNHFTLPIWMNEDGSEDEWTEVSVPVKTPELENELKRNFNDWVENPASILFFKTLRSLTIEGEELTWQKREDGPVAGSEWVSIKGGDGKKFLHVRSDIMKFPSIAEDEIRSERDIALGEDLPGFHIEVVLGMAGNLYVILPTHLNLEIPFAINAPFLQDPARSGLKDIALSPTNRWLLQQSGELAAKTMTHWLQNRELDIEDRAQAYRLLILPVGDESSTVKQLRFVVQNGFIQGLDTNRILLSEKGLVTEKNRCHALPKTIMEVWPDKQLTDFFIDSDAQILSRYVSSNAVEILSRYSLIASTTKSDIMSQLRRKNPPRPETFIKIFQLWAYLADEIINDWSGGNKIVSIIPVKGLKTLLPYTDVVRLGEKKENLKEDDWTYLSQYMLVVDQGWPKFITRLLRESESIPNAPSLAAIRKVQELMGKLELKDPSDTSTMMQRVGAIFFNSPIIAIKDSIKLSHIAARLKANVGDSFRFYTQDGQLADRDGTIIADFSAQLEDLVPEEYREEHFLHHDYNKENETCSHDEWQNWINSNRTPLLRFFHFNEVKESWSYREEEFLKNLKVRGFSGQISKRFKTKYFEIVEPEFDRDLIEYWDDLGSDDSSVWPRIVEGLIKDPRRTWEKVLYASANQISNKNTRASVLDGDIAPTWVLRLRELPCMEDTNGHFRIPRELHCRTSANEAVLNIEPFVRADLDNKDSSTLLERLGVLTSPIGPGNILNIISELTKNNPSQIPDLDQWYRRLDRILWEAETEIIEESIARFKTEALIPTNQDDWARSEHVFLQMGDMDDPGLPLIPETLRTLRVWQTLEVPERPTFDLTLTWLESLPVEEPLAPKSIERLKSILNKQADQVLSHAKHWLNANEEWVPVNDLKYHYGTSSGIDASTLFMQYRQVIADCTMIHLYLEQSLFGDTLEDLTKILHFKLGDKTSIIGSATRKNWLTRFGQVMSRVMLDRPEDELRVHEVSRLMTQTAFQKAERLMRVPSIGGVAAGTIQESNVLFFGNKVYHANLSDAKIMDAVISELGRHLGNSASIAALRDCYERSVAFVEEILYSKFNFYEEDRPVKETEAYGESTNPQNEIPKAETIPQGDEDEFDQDEYSHQNRDDEISPDETPEVDASAPDQKDPDPKPEPDPEPEPEPELTLIDRYAAEIGFKNSGNSTYYHPDGRRLEYDRNAIFKWLQVSSQGESLFKYGVFNVCLDTHPLEMNAEMWLSLQDNPEDSGLLLLDLQGKPILIEGFDLKQMAADHVIDLLPAKYRIVKKR